MVENREIKRPGWGTTMGAILFLIAAITNPDTEQHKLEVRKYAQQRIQNSLSDDRVAGFENLASLLGNTMTENLIVNNITRENYLFFSMTIASSKDRSKTIGFGLFGNVFLSDAAKEALCGKRPL